MTDIYNLSRKGTQKSSYLGGIPEEQGALHNSKGPSKEAVKISGDRLQAILQYKSTKADIYNLRRNRSRLHLDIPNGKENERYGEQSMVEKNTSFKRKVEDVNDYWYPHTLHQKKSYLGVIPEENKGVLNFTPPSKDDVVISGDGLQAILQYESSMSTSPFIGCTKTPNNSPSKTI